MLDQWQNKIYYAQTNFLNIFELLLPAVCIAYPVLELTENDVFPVICCMHKIKVQVVWKKCLVKIIGIVCQNTCSIANGGKNAKLSTCTRNYLICVMKYE